MGRSLRALASAALVLGWLGSLGSSIAFGAPRRAPAAATHGDGWVVDRVVVEPLQPSIAPLTVTELGSYPGRIELTRTPAGVGVLNRVAFDDYVAGISEMPSAWPFEALKAQAIAARTYALWDARRTPPNAAYKAAGADICATQACQVYTGLAKTRALNGERWAAAVAATKDAVLLWRGEPIVAKYSSSNGGASIGGGQPYLRAVADPEDAYSPLHRWRSTVTLEQLAAAFGLSSPPVAVRRAGDQIEMDVLEHDRVMRTVAIPILDFRAKANETIPPPAGMSRTVPSVQFDVVAIEGGVVLDGRGYGHGIGLSQWGAYGKAGRGMKAPEILAAYYGGLKPVAAPAAMVPETILVALDLDRAVTEVGAESGGRFRLRGGDGQVLAHAAVGAWRVEPAPDGKVRVRPPVDQADAVAVEHVGTSPALPEPDDPLVVTLRLPEPAMVTASAAPPSGGPQVTLGEPRLLKDGEVTIRLPPAGAPGSYSVDVATDLGGGRTNTTTFVIAVGAEGSAAGEDGVEAAAGAANRDKSGPPSGGPATLVAIALLTAVGAELVRRLRTGLGTPAVDQLH